MASTFLHITIKHIDSKINEGSNLSKGLKSEAKAFVSVLKDDLDRQLAVGERQLSSKDRPLIAQLRRIAYDAEDVVDTAVAEYSVLMTCLGIGDNEAQKKLVKQNGLISELKRVIGQDFKGSTSETMPPARGPQSSKGPAAADNDLVIGIDHEIMTVVDLLTRKFKDGHEPVDKLAIVGMGGSGKTTLARSIYNHKVINKHFQFQAWVSASQIRDPSLLLLDILTQIRDQKKWFSRFYQPRDDEKPGEDSNRWVSRINDLLYQKSCLLVLDDVWDMQSLHDFIALIQGDDYNSPRYTIIITSRQTPSSDNMRWYIHQPQLLTDEKCRELFSKAASKNHSEPLSNDYHSLAMEMLKKCQGLPLAIVALARLLRTKDTPHEWQRVLSKVTGTDATTMYGPVKEILGLSYDRLPYYLKPYFLYLGLFPEGSDISSGTLIRIWIAEGFIETMNEETLEVAATRYLQELIDHTMVQIVRKKFSGKVKTIRIHNIMRDFCLSRARDLDFLIVSGSRPEGIGKTSRRGVINLSPCIYVYLHIESISLPLTVSDEARVLDAQEF